MKLHSSGFERNLKRAVRATVRSSPELRKEVRRVRKPWNYSLRLPGRVCLAALLAMMVLWMGRQSANPQTALAVISLWMFVWLCGRVRGLLDVLYSDADLNAFSLLPISASQVFRWQLQKFLRACVMSLVDLFAGLAALGIVQDFTTGQWVLLPLIALLSWVSFLALVFVCAAHWPNLPYGMVWGFGWLAGAVLFIGRDFLGKYAIAFFNHAAPVCNLLPTGWPLSLALIERGQWLPLVLLVPVLGLICALNGAVARLRENYEFNEIVRTEAPDLIPDGAVQTVSAPRAAWPSPHLGVTAIEEIIRTRQFIADSKWHADGLLESLLWRWLNSRERALVEFVFPEGLTISLSWRRIFRNLLVVVVAAFVVGMASPALRTWILGLGIGATICQSLVRIHGSGRAFQPVECSGVHIPLYAAYAIGFRELAHLLFKCSLVQSFPFVPFVTVCASLVAYLASWPWATGVIFGLKAGGILMAARFISVTFAFSSGTNDSSRLNVRTLALIIAVIGLALLCLGLAAASLFVPLAGDLAMVGVVAWSFWVVALLGAYLLFRIYGWFYHANRFDLMKLRE